MLASSRVSGEATPAAIVGYVEAPDAESAIAKAIEEFKITDPMRWRRQENLERCKMRWPLKEALRQPCYLDVLAFLD